MANDLDDHVSIALKPFFVFAAIFGYFALPFFSLAEPVWLYLFGFLLAVGVTSVLQSYYRHDTKQLVLATIFAATGLAGLAWCSYSTIRRDHIMSQRCLVVESDMLSGSPRLADAPAVFEALKCRPQIEAPMVLQPVPKLPTPPASTSPTPEPAPPVGERK